MWRKSNVFIGLMVVSFGLSCCLKVSAQKPEKIIQIPGLQVFNNVKDYDSLVHSDSILTFVSLEKNLIPLYVDWRYASANNFTGKILYKNPALFARLPAAEALKKVQAVLLPMGLSLQFFDAYRPYSVTKKMWKIVPDPRYAANPARGSSHNRGIAVDVTLVNSATGKPLPMPTAYDDFTEKAHHDFNDLPADIIKNRALLKSTMEKCGFIALDSEWWHYSLPNPQKYPVMNLSFREMKKAVGKRR